MRPPQVKIENPCIGGSDHTSMERARRFVRKGRAEFTSPATIRFLDSAQQQRFRMQAEQRLHGRLTGGGYDRVDRVLSEAEMMHLPLLDPARMIRRERSDRGWSFAAAVRRDSTRPDSPAEVAAARSRGLGHGVR